MLAGLSCASKWFVELEVCKLLTALSQCSSSVFLLTCLATVYHSGVWCDFSEQYTLTELCLSVWGICTGSKTNNSPNQLATLHHCSVFPAMSDCHQMHRLVLMLQALWRRLLTMTSYLLACCTTDRQLISLISVLKELVRGKQVWVVTV